MPTAEPRILLRHKRSQGTALAQGLGRASADNDHVGAAADAPRRGGGVAARAREGGRVRGGGGGGGPRDTVARHEQLRLAARRLRRQKGASEQLAARGVGERRLARGGGGVAGAPLLEPRPDGRARVGLCDQRHREGGRHVQPLRELDEAAHLLADDVRGEGVEEGRRRGGERVVGPVLDRVDDDRAGGRDACAEHKARHRKRVRIEIAGPRGVCRGRRLRGQR